MPCAIMRPLVFKLVCYRYLAFDIALSLSLNEARKLLFLSSPHFY